MECFFLECYGGVNMKNEKMLGRCQLELAVHQEIAAVLSSYFTPQPELWPQLKAKDGRHQETLDLGPFTCRSLGKSVMFLDVFWVLYPQNEEDSSQTYSVTGIADHYAISSSSSYLSDRQTTTPKITRFAWNDSDRFGVALCRTYEATQPRLRRQWAGLPATSPSGTAGRELLFCLVGCGCTAQ